MVQNKVTHIRHEYHLGPFTSSSNSPSRQTGVLRQRSVKKTGAGYQIKLPTLPQWHGSPEANHTSHSGFLAIQKSGIIQVYLRFVPCNLG